MATPKDISLSCDAVAGHGAVILSYRIKNSSAAAIYVADLLPLASIANETAPLASVIAGDDHVTVLRGMPPLPGFAVPMRIMPLGTALAAATSLDRALSIKVPLAEHSPYFAGLPLRQYEYSVVNSLTLVVHVIRPTAPGFELQDAPEFGVGAVHVSSDNTVLSLETLTCSIPMRGLTVLRRRDNFVRAL